MNTDRFRCGIPRETKSNQLKGGKLKIFRPKGVILLVNTLYNIYFRKYYN